MKSGLVMVNMFMKQQDVYVFEDNKSIVHRQVNLDDLPEYINKLNQEYSLEFVRLMGAERYNQGLKEECMKINQTEYSNHPLNIKLGGE